MKQEFIKAARAVKACTKVLSSASEKDIELLRNAAIIFIDRSYDEPWTIYGDSEDTDEEEFAIMNSEIWVWMPHKINALGHSLTD